jgi:hypothetical protein
MTFIKALFSSPEEPAGMTWEQAYLLLANSKTDSDSEAIAHAITRLGKPYEQDQVRRAAPLVAKRLHHENHVVRYQAIWFLGCWAKMRDYLHFVLQSALSDSDPDNRAFAARCVGSILESHRDVAAIKTLLRLVVTAEEEPDLRLAAYGSLLRAVHGESARRQAKQFSPLGDKSVADFDVVWLASLPGWIEQLPAPLK